MKYLTTGFTWIAQDTLNFLGGQYREWRRSRGAWRWNDQSLGKLHSLWRWRARGLHCVPLAGWLALYQICIIDLIKIAFLNVLFLIGEKQNPISVLNPYGKSKKCNVFLERWHLTGPERIFLLGWDWSSW